MVFNQVVTIHDGQKIPVYTSLYFLSQNSQPLLPRFVPGDSLSALRGEDAVHPQRSCVTAVLCHGCQDVGRPGPHCPTLESASPLPPENLKLLLRCYICLFGSVSHASMVFHMLFFSRS